MDIEKKCCKLTRLGEAGAWMDTVLELQEEVKRLKEVEKRRNAMLQLHKGFNGICSSKVCGIWPCPTYLACYPETAWSPDERT